MAKYSVSGVVTISVYTEVEAESISEAIDKAKEQPMQGFCGQCARQDPSEQWTTSELDGEPYDLEIAYILDDTAKEK